MPEAIESGLVSRFGGSSAVQPPKTPPKPHNIHQKRRLDLPDKYA